MHTQTRRDDMTTPTAKAGTTENLLDDQIEPFLKHLRAAGYAQRTHATQEKNGRESLRPMDETEADRHR